MKAIAEYMLINGKQLRIEYDENASDPREWDNIGKLCIREHRRYNFPNELDFDFDLWYDYTGDDGSFNEKDWEQYDIDRYNEMKEIFDDNYIFWIDCYEHSGIAFSISGGGMQCQFDTSKDCGFIAIPKTGDGKVFDISENEARKIAEDELKLFNQYMNGEVYAYSILSPVKWTSEDGREEIEYKYEDGCSGYYSIEDILEEFKDLKPEEI